MNFFTVFLGIASVVSTHYQINVIYTDLQPFIFTQPNGNVVGIIPLQLEQGIKICRNLKSNTNQGSINYVAKLDSLNKLYQLAFSKRVSCENSSWLNLSRSNVFLYPLVSSLHYHRKPVQAYEKRVIHDHEFELIKTTKIAVIIYR